jgi:hypothetical protein
MPLRFVLDEHLRGPLWGAIQQHNAGGSDVIDAVRVGDLPDLPLGTTDPDLLLWAEREGRVVVSRDWNTFPHHLAVHLLSGRHSPGVVILRPGHTLPQLVFTLALAAHAADPGEFRDQVRFLP